MKPQLSELEFALLEQMHRLYQGLGFPPPTEIWVHGREDTGSGRYVDIESAALLGMKDGYLDLGGRFIQMAGVRGGLMAVVEVRDHRLQRLEIAVYGEGAWDGTERDWSIL
jgi:hypothetical protein